MRLPVRAQILPGVLGPGREEPQLVAALLDSPPALVGAVAPGDEAPRRGGDVESLQLALEEGEGEDYGFTRLSQQVDLGTRRVAVVWGGGGGGSQHDVYIHFSFNPRHNKATQTRLYVCYPSSLLNAHLWWAEPAESLLHRQVGGGARRAGAPGPP